MKKHKFTNICITANKQIILNTNIKETDEKTIRETEKEMLKLLTDNMDLLNLRNRNLEINHYIIER